MSDDRTSPNERSDLAGEYALGLLSGSDLRRAHALAQSDPEFRAEVARWSRRLGPMLDEVAAVPPPEFAWAAIKSRLDGLRGDHTVVQLRRRIRQWRVVAAGMTAMAASLALVVALRPLPPQPSPIEVARPVSAPLVAMLGTQGKPADVVASWDPSARQLILAVAGHVPSDPSHSRELWVIPQGGKPRSLGTLPESRQTHMQLADALAQLLQQGATIAISVEPRGGSPTGSPTGPVVASGPLSRA
ncbi:MAG TPA: anti-sigma factor [Sphingomicrobium sp.]|nr:anti-sigma factor [Sphingomicrobium sp.]